VKLATFDNILPDSFNYQTSSSTAYLEKLIVTQLINKFPVFYGTRSFHIVFSPLYIFIYVDERFSVELLANFLHI
jgi:hypothetical protein